MLEVDNLHEKIHNIGFATFRVASLIRHRELRQEIESVVIQLTKTPHTSHVDSLMRLIKLAVSVHEIANINGDVLNKELLALRNTLISAVAVLPDDVAIMDLGGIFKEETHKEREKSKQYRVNNEAIRTSSVYPQKRRIALHEFIRQLPDGCRMRDLMVQFPDVSERTLRSDIQKLVDKGIIERVGSKSGPFSYLRAVDSPKKDSINIEDTLNEYAFLSEVDPRD